LPVCCAVNGVLCMLHAALSSKMTRYWCDDWHVFHVVLQIAAVRRLLF